MSVKGPKNIDVRLAVAANTAMFWKSEAAKRGLSTASLIKIAMHAYLGEDDLLNGSPAHEDDED